MRQKIATISDLQVHIFSLRTFEYLKKKKENDNYPGKPESSLCNIGPQSPICTFHKITYLNKTLYVQQIIQNLNNTGIINCKKEQK